MANGLDFFGARYLRLHVVLLEQTKGKSFAHGIPGHRKARASRAGAAKTQGGAGSPWRDGATELIGPHPACRPPSPMRRRTGEGDNPKKLCLLPFEEWEKVAEGRMMASLPRASNGLGSPMRF